MSSSFSMNFGDVLVWHAHRRQQDDPGAQLNARLDPFAVGQIAQTLIIFSTEQDGLGNSHGYDLQHSWRSHRHIGSVIYGALH
jgi:hypothetical protein